MPSVMYLHTSMHGSYWVPCEVVARLDKDTFNIRYEDPIIEDVVIETVNVDQLKFPVYSELII
jgi:hypothetical protein